MSDIPGISQHAAQTSPGRILHDIGTLLPALTVLAIVGGFLWFIVGLTINPIQKDVAEIKTAVEKIEGHVGDLRVEVGTIRGMLEAAGFNGVSFEATGVNQQPPAVVQDFDAERAIVYTNTPWPSGDD